MTSGSGQSGAARIIRTPGDRTVWALIAVVALAAAAISAFRVTDLPPPGSTPGHPAVILIILLLGFAVAERAVVHVPFGRNAFSLTLNEIPLVVGLFLLPPTHLVFARVLGAVVPLAMRNRRSLIKLSFNLAQFALEAATVVVVWRAVLGDAEPLGPRGWLAVGVALLVSDLLGTTLIALAIAAHAGERPRLTSDLVSLGPVSPLVNASFALVLVYVVSYDWRALWTVAVVMAVLLFAHQAHNGLRRRNEGLEQLSLFTGEIGSQLDVASAAQAAVMWIGKVLHAEVAELTLTERFGGRERRWIGRYDGSAGESAEAGETATSLATALGPWLQDGPVLVRRGGRDRALLHAAHTAGLRDALAMPLRGDGEVIGTLLVGDRLGDVETFAKEDLRELQALGNHLSVTLRNARRADLIAEHAAEQLRKSMHDELTELPNRRHLEEQIAQALDASGDAAVVLLDLDRFKDINEALGHRAGDLLLCMVAERLQRFVPGDAVLARIGSDQFAVLLATPDVVTTGSAATLLRHAFSHPFELDDLPVTVEASVGVAFAEAGSGAADLLRRADVAMCAAKTSQTGLETYREELDRGRVQRLTLLTELKDAISDGALTVHFQPKVRLRDGAVVGVEALVRWQHPRRGLVPPDEFIPVAEHSGLITPLTLTVLRQSLDGVQSWRRAGKTLGVAVNISPRSLLDQSFPDEVARVLATVEVPSAAVTFEITESSLMAEPERAIEALQRLRELGVRLSIDDLGTGYSSLAYLQRLPVQEVKIDRSFLKPAHGTSEVDSFAIVAAVVELGHRLGREVVAEGVEDEATWRRLQRLGCDVAQGYWMSRPLPGGELLAWLNTWRPTNAAALRAVP